MMGSTRVLGIQARVAQPGAAAPHTIGALHGEEGRERIGPCAKRNAESCAAGVDDEERVAVVRRV